MIVPLQVKPQREQEKHQQQQVNVPVGEGLCLPNWRPQIKRGWPFLLLPQCLNPPVEVTRRRAWEIWCRMVVVGRARDRIHCDLPEAGPGR